MFWGICASFLSRRGFPKGWGSHNFLRDHIHVHTIGACEEQLCGLQALIKKGKGVFLFLHRNAQSRNRNKPPCPLIPVSCQPVILRGQQCGTTVTPGSFPSSEAFGSRFHPEVWFSTTHSDHMVHSKKKKYQCLLSDQLNLKC